LTHGIQAFFRTRATYAAQIDRFGLHMQPCAEKR
jgi:hypothetical protein